MSDMRDIIGLSLAIGEKAREIYLGLSREAKQTELRRFWRSMAGEEKKYISFWDDIRALSNGGKVQQVFDSPEHVMAELDAIYENVSRLSEQRKVLRRVSDAFIIAYRLEFYMLHPAFERLFHFMSSLSTSLVDPEAEYEAHINRLIAACKEYGRTTPEIDLLGATIQRLWTDNKRLALQSDIDSLTGVYNRRGLFRIIRVLAFLAQRNRENVGVMMADIDDFKLINDTHGHQAGDEVIRKVSAIIRAHIRTSDIVGRYGGEEFMVFLPKVGGEHFYGLAEKIRARVEEETRGGVPVTVSLGIAQGVVKDDVEGEIEALIRRADACLFEAKRTTKNRVVMSGGFRPGGGSSRGRTRGTSPRKPGGRKN